MTSPTTDAFYWIATVVVVILTAWSLLRPGAAGLKNGRWQILCLALASFVSLIVFLLLLSITFDFGSCFYPSRDNPYFTSGRLLSAAAVPFFCLYVYVIDWITERSRHRWLGFFLLGLTLLLITISQVCVNWPTLTSRYNFFHLPSG